jgi:uncharacterized protein
MNESALVVLAKAPVPGRSKTRLSPPLTHADAALVAEACLGDTLEAVTATPIPRKVIVLEGRAGGWMTPGIEVVPQRSGDLADRLNGAFEDAGTPALLIGMDTPQVSTARLSGALRALSSPGVDAVLGLTPDGGYWAVGLRGPRSNVFSGVPMSTRWTGTAQLDRFARLGLRCHLLPQLRDIDYFSDAIDVAKQVPESRLAGMVRQITPAREAFA